MKAVLSYSLEGEYAGFISRAMAIVLDIFLANIVIIAVAIGAEWILGYFTFGGYFSDGGRLSDMGQLVLNLIVGVTVFTMTNLYPMVFWMLTGQTIGKAVMGLRVVQVQGKPITFSVALRRLIGYYLSALFLFLGFLWVSVDDRRRGWHDKLAGTCVVYSWNAHGSDRLSDSLAKYISTSQTKA